MLKMYSAPERSRRNTGRNGPVGGHRLSETQDHPSIYNLEIIEKHGEAITRGCVRAVFFEPVKRATDLHLRAINRAGAVVELSSGLLRGIQHELDHPGMLSLILLAL